MSQSYPPYAAPPRTQTKSSSKALWWILGIVSGGFALLLAVCGGLGWFVYSSMQPGKPVTRTSRDGTIAMDVPENMRPLSEPSPVAILGYENQLAERYVMVIPEDEAAGRLIGESSSEMRALCQGHLDQYSGLRRQSGTAKTIGGRPAYQICARGTVEGVDATMWFTAVRGADYPYIIYAWTVTPRRSLNEPILMNIVDSFRELGPDGEPLKSIDTTSTDTTSTDTTSTDTSPPNDAGNAASSDASDPSQPPRGTNVSANRRLNASINIGEINRFPTVDLALQTLRSGHLPPGADPGQVHRRSQDDLRVAAFDYLSHQSLPQDQADSFERITIDLTRQTDVDSDFTQAILNSDVAFRDQALTNVAKVSLGDYSHKDVLFPWLQTKHPPELIDEIILEARSDRRFQDLLIEHYPDAPVELVRRQLNEDLFASSYATLLERVGDVPIESIQPLLIEALADADASNDYYVLERLTDQPVPELNDPLRQAVSNFLVRPGNLSHQTERLVQRFIPWVTPNQRVDFVSSVNLRSFNGAAMAIALVELDDADVDRALVTKLEKLGFKLDDFAEPLIAMPQRRSRFEAAVRRGTDPSDESHAVACAELLGLIGDASSVTPLRRLLAVAEQNSMYRLERQTNEALKQLKLRLGDEFDREVQRGNRRPRTWTAKAGQTVIATLAGRTGDQIKLRKQDGTTITVPLSALSQADQTHIQQIEPQTP